MAAAKGIKELEDELESLRNQVVGDNPEDGEENEPDQPSFRSEENLITPPKKSEAPQDKEEDTFKKRYGDLRRYSQKQKEEFEAKIADLQRQLNNKPSGDSPPTNPDDVKAWVEKYPQVAAIIQALAEEKATKLYGEDIQSIKKETAEAKRLRELNKIYSKHDDFDSIKEDDKFHDWAESQPEFIQNFIYKGSADQVIWALDRYKESFERKPNIDKEAAKSLGKTTKTAPAVGDGKRRFTESEIEDMSASEYAALENEIQDAIRDGRFTYDISEAAR